MARGLFAGGNSGVFSDVIDYVDIDSTGNALDFGDLSVARHRSYGCSSTTRGLFAGGNAGGGGFNVIDYVTIATDANALDFGDMTTGKAETAACSSNITGVFAGSFTGASNVIDYVTIATLANAEDFGDLTVGRGLMGSFSSDTRGVFGGGHGGSLRNIIDYITIASPGNATDFGDLTVAKYALTGCSSPTRGLFAGGTDTPVNVIEYITIATLGDAIDFGDMTNTRQYLAACSSHSRGLFGGGYSGGNIDIIDYVTIASLGDASDFGDLTVARQGVAALSDSHGGLVLSLPPEMLIEYNATPITSGDATPSGPDGTFFGSADIVTTTIEKIFSITNSGEDNLTLDADPYVAVSGTNADQFSIIEQPASGTLPEGYSFDFTVEFDPTTTGQKNAWIVIYNNTTENPFTFAIQGSGISAPTIDLSTSTLSATGIFGQSVSDKTFDINNTGSALLEYDLTSNKTWVTFDEDSGTIASGASETVTVSIDPNGLAFNATHVATITVTDADASNSPQTLQLSLTINHGESFLYTNPQNVNRVRTSSALLLQPRTDSGVQKINYSRQFTGDNEVTTDGGFITFNPLTGPETNDYDHS